MLHAVFERPYVISWNLTYRCNLACEHCYLDAGGKPAVTSEAFSDRSELDTEGCREVIDQIAEFAPEALTILTGGEPLLLPDLEEKGGSGRAEKVLVMISKRHKFIERVNESTSISKHPDQNKFNTLRISKS